MKINYGREHLYAVHEELVEYFNGSVSRSITAEMACNAFLAEFLETEYA